MSLKNVLCLFLMSAFLWNSGCATSSGGSADRNVAAVGRPLKITVLKDIPLSKQGSTANYAFWEKLFRGTQQTMAQDRGWLFGLRSLSGLGRDAHCRVNQATDPRASASILKAGTYSSPLEEHIFEENDKFSFKAISLRINEADLVCFFNDQQLGIREANEILNSFIVLEE